MPAVQGPAADRQQHVLPLFEEVLRRSAFVEETLAQELQPIWPVTPCLRAACPSRRCGRRVGGGKCNAGGAGCARR
jgi:hypothetical protein